MPQRYQQEIEEILGRSDSETATGKANEPVVPRAERTPIVRSSQREHRGLKSSILAELAPGRLLLIGIMLLLTAMILRSAVPGVAGWLTWVGVGSCIGAYVIFFIRPRRLVERRWRGRSIETTPSSSRNTPLHRIWTWLNRE